MKETTLTRDISINIGCAAQLEIEGDYRAELRHLLFAARDVSEVLQEYRLSGLATISPTEWISHSTGKRYAKLFVRISKRVAELIEQGT